MTSPEPSRRTEKERVYAAAVFGCLASVVLYAAFRLMEAWLLPEPNPAVVIWSARSGYVWRVVLALYFGGALAIEAYALMRIPARRLWLLRHLLTLACLAAGVLLVQALVLP